MNTRLLTEAAKQTLRAHGWSDGFDSSARISEWVRQLGSEFTISPAAHDALRRYGGVRIAQNGRGEECGRDSFVIDPLCGYGEADRFAHFGLRLGKDLFPVGEAVNGNYYLAISPDGCVYALMQEIWLVADSIDDAIAKLVRGLRWDWLSDW